MLQIELENVTSGFDSYRHKSLTQVNELKDNVIHWQNQVKTY